MGYEDEDDEEEAEGDDDDGGEEETTSLLRADFRLPEQRQQQHHARNKRGADSIAIPLPIKRAKRTSVTAGEIPTPKDLATALIQHQGEIEGVPRGGYHSLRFFKERRETDVSDEETKQKNSHLRRPLLASLPRLRDPAPSPLDPILGHPLLLLSEQQE